MLSLEESLKILKETNALLEGHFILSSGLHSPQYVQCAKLMSKPEKAHKICASLSEKIIKVMNMDPNEISKMGNNGRENVLKKFNVEKMCFSTYSEYKKLFN